MSDVRNVELSDIRNVELRDVRNVKLSDARNVELNDVRNNAKRMPIQDLVQDTDTLAEDWYIAMEALCGWLSRAIPKSNRKEFIKKVEEMLHLVPGPVVFIYGQSIMESGSKEKEKLAFNLLLYVLPNDMLGNLCRRQCFSLVLVALLSCLLRLRSGIEVGFCGLVSFRSRSGHGGAFRSSVPGGASRSYFRSQSAPCGAFRSSVRGGLRVLAQETAELHPAQSRGRRSRPRCQSRPYRPLAAPRRAGSFDCVIHKLHGEEWKIQLLDFAATNPSVPIVDQPLAIERLHNRITASPCSSSSPSSMSLMGPKQVLVYDSNRISLSRINDLQFPIIFKPLVSHGIPNHVKVEEGAIP
ncbi:hypothetical protein ZIOFF_010256 [Zingiber officinale]|uniref:Inositol-tetrakisphosphate 1-kinase N-terminal domain-containing protein n=1 Tax=Zingiber officinale TaxID=94328 RepID=A0A8J5LY60_ZINOF|nr:hypothetical protein ZIOFF_010256 [Zingiber officinale]